MITSEFGLPDAAMHRNSINVVQASRRTTIYCLERLPFLALGNTRGSFSEAISGLLLFLTIVQPRALSKMS